MGSGCFTNKPIKDSAIFWFDRAKQLLNENLCGKIPRTFLIVKLDNFIAN